MEEAKANEVRDRKEYQELENSINLFNRFAWGLVIVGAVFMAVIAGKLINGNPQWAQTLGDFTGGVVASFWSLAGIMFVYTAFLGQKQQLMLQEEELRLNREEMIATRMEIEGQKLQLEEQSKTAALQRFESTFFNILKTIEVSISELVIGNNKNGFTSGHRVIDMYVGDWKSTVKKQSNPSLALEDIISNSFDKYYSGAKEKGLNSAINLLLLVDLIYLMLDFVEKNNLSESQKKFYNKLLLTKLSDSLITFSLYKVYWGFENREKGKLLINALKTDALGSQNQYLLDHSHRQLF